MLEQIHANLLSAAAELMADFLSESTQANAVNNCVGAGGRLQLEIDYPRTSFDQWRVRVFLLEPLGKRHLLADVAQVNCTQ